MKKQSRKLSGCSGETLTETLCALLVVALSSVALATMLSVANRLNASAIQRDDVLYTGLTAAETRDGAGETSYVYVKLPGESAPKAIPVTWYGEDGLWSYAGDFPAPEEGGGAP